MRRYVALPTLAMFISRSVCIFWLLDPGAQAVRESTAEQDQTVAAGPSALCGPIGAAGPHKRRPIYVRTARIMHNMVISQKSLCSSLLWYYAVQKLGDEFRTACFYARAWRPEEARRRVPKAVLTDVCNQATLMMDLVCYTIRTVPDFLSFSLRRVV